MIKSFRLTFSFPLLFGLLFISSCKKENRWDLFKGTGKRTTETRTLPAFTKIHLEDNINVIITQGNVQEVKVEAGEKLLPLIKTEVDTGTIHLFDKNKCNWARSYKKGVITVYLTMPSLRFILHNGSGNISCTDTITCDTLNIQPRESGDIELTLKANIIYGQLHGSSDVTLHGISPLMGVYHLGEGYLYAGDFKTDEVWVYSKASGETYINAKNGITAKILWVGSIYYKGNPSYVFSEVAGTGKLIRID